MRAGGARRVEAPDDPARAGVGTNGQSLGAGMKRISRLVLFLIAVVIAGGAVFLVTWDIPTPLVTIEKVLPDDRFPH